MVFVSKNKGSQKVRCGLYRVSKRGGDNKMFSEQGQKHFDKYDAKELARRLRKHGLEAFKIMGYTKNDVSLLTKLFWENRNAARALLDVVEGPYLKVGDKEKLAEIVKLRKRILRHYNRNDLESIVRIILEEER